MSRRHDGDAHALCQSRRPRDADRASFFVVGAFLTLRGVRV
nr:MAG TPA: hypothetical protein [Caudoviricetes sp.]